MLHLSSQLAQRVFFLIFLGIQFFPTEVLAASLLTEPESARMEVFAFQQVNEPAQALKPLELNQPIRQTIKGDEQHSYRLKLAPNQLIHVQLDQDGVDVGMHLVNSTGAMVFDAESPTRETGRDELEFLVEQEGEYQLIIEPYYPGNLSPGDKVGRYEIVLSELRLAKPEEKQRLLIATMAFQVYMEVVQLIPHKSPDAISRMISKCQELIRLCRESGKQVWEMETLNTLTVTLEKQGSYAEALNYIEVGLQLAQKLKDPLFEALFRNTSGKIAYETGEYQRSHENYTQALTLMRALSNQVEEANILNNLAVLMHKLGFFDQATEYYEHAVSVFEAANSPLQKANTLTSLGAIYRIQKKYSKARTCFETAIPILLAHKLYDQVAITQLNLAKLAEDLNELKPRLEILQQAVENAQKTKNKPVQARMLNEFGYALSVDGQIEKAKSLYSQALELLAGYQVPDVEISIHCRRAQVEFGAGNYQQALTLIEPAVQITERVRGRIADTKLRQNYMSGVRNTYELYIAILMKLHQKDPSAGYQVRALKASEMIRSRVLIDLLSEANIDTRKGAAPELLKEEAELQTRIEYQSALVSQLLNRANVTADQRTLAEKELVGLIEKLDHVQAQIRERNPAYAQLMLPQLVRLEEIQKDWLDKDTIAVEFSLGPSMSYVWVITQNEVQSFELPGQDEITSQCKTVYDLLTARLIREGESDDAYLARNQGVDQQYWKSATQLSQVVLSPILSRFPCKRIVVVADGALHFIPFAALPHVSATADGRGETTSKKTSVQPVHPAKTDSSPPLLATHEVVNVPSLSALLAIQSQVGRRDQGSHNLIVIADPVFDTTDERLAHGSAPIAKPSVAETESRQRNLQKLFGLQGTQLRSAIQRLPGTRQEALAIQKIAASPALKLTLDFDASRATIQNKGLEGYRYIHLATHGFCNLEYPELSGLVFSMVDAKGQPQNGFLRLQDIYNLNLSADLVVLSACQTAVGKEIQGEGVVGLSRGFFYAGTPRLIGSLWAVNDGSTSELMTLFYNHLLKEKQSPAQALRQAQLMMWKRNPKKVPFTWAAFVFQGNWKQVTP